MARSGRRYHIIRNLPTCLETHLAVHRVGWLAVNFIFAIFRSFYVDLPFMSCKIRIQSVL